MAAPPAMIGRYQLGERLAVGMVAEVFRACDTETGQWCALRRLLPALAGERARRTSFERAGRLLSRLDHPCIVKVHDMGEDQGESYMIMDLAEGGSAADWLERNHRPMPPRMAISLLLPICRAIQYVHNQGVIHRNITAHNLLLMADGSCRLSGFSSALDAVGPAQVMLPNTVVGTPGYVAPEQSESAMHADERADIYSMAATLYTLVHGEIANHLFLADDSDYQGIPTPLADIIRRGAQYQRAVRHTTVADFADDLEAIFERLPLDPPDTPPLVPPFERSRHPLV